MIDRDSAEHYTWGSGCDAWHLVRVASLSVIEERMPPGTSEALHLHRHSRQFFHVLAGTLSIVLPDRSELLSVRQGLEIPPGTPHRVHNASGEPVEFLVVSEPPSHGDRLEG